MATLAAPVYKCEWPGGCPYDASLRIGTTHLHPFYVCPSHAERWRCLPYPAMVDVHAHRHHRRSIAAGAHSSIGQRHIE